jgi:hypothetical protein
MVLVLVGKFLFSQVSAVEKYHALEESRAWRKGVSWRV